MDTMWKTEFQYLMDEARKHLDPAWESGEVIVVKTAKGNVYTVEIPDVQDFTVREPLENQLIQTLTKLHDTTVSACVATIDGAHPEIPSWNFRSGLVSADPANLDAKTILWGGNVCYVKTFRSLLPPEKN